MPFLKGNIAWNKGTHIQTNNALENYRNMHSSWNKGKKTGSLTIEHRIKIGESNRGEKSHLWKGGLPRCLDCGKEVCHYGVKRCRKCENLQRLGEKSPSWKGGISKDKNYILQRNKERRHRLGISKKYNFQLGISHTREYRKLQHQKRKALMKGGGELSIKTIQLVYEDNIKQYGTLTCYLCLKPIEFSQDSLEHKQPLSRGGTNEYNNLAIAHLSCNKKKHKKTEAEYREDLIS